MNSYLSENFVAEVDHESFVPSTPSIGSQLQQSPLVSQQHQQQRASSVVSHSSQHTVGSETFGGAFQGQSPITHSVNSPAASQHYGSPLLGSAGCAGPSAMASMLSSYGQYDSSPTPGLYYGANSSVNRDVCKSYLSDGSQGQSYMQRGSETAGASFYTSSHLQQQHWMNGASRTASWGRSAGVAAGTNGTYADYGFNGYAAGENGGLVRVPEDHLSRQQSIDGAYQHMAHGYQSLSHSSHTYGQGMAPSNSYFDPLHRPQQTYPGREYLPQPVPFSAGPHARAKLAADYVRSAGAVDPAHYQDAYQRGLLHNMTGRYYH